MEPTIVSSGASAHDPAPPNHARPVRPRALGSLPVAAALLLGACGGGGAQAVGSAGAAAPAGPELTDLEAVATESGSSVEVEPTPMGTLIAGPGAADVFWVQALSDEGAADFDAIATETTALGRLRRPADGMSQLRVSRGGVHRMIGARDGADPARVADAAFALDALPAGWRFVASSPAATVALGPDRTDDQLPAGVEAVSLATASGADVEVVVTPGAADGLAGLLADLVRVAPGVFAGAAAPGDEVVLVDDVAHRRTLIIRADSARPTDLLDARTEIAAAAAAALDG